MARLITTALAASLIGLAVLVLTSPYRLYVVRTGSMSPTIPTASAVLVDPRQSPRLMDVVTFRYDGRLTTHRLVHINRDGTLVTKGDANSAPDPWKLTRANMVGPVVAHLPRLGWLIVYLRQPTGLLSLLLLPILLRMAWQITAPASPARRPARNVPESAQP